MVSAFNNSLQNPARITTNMHSVTKPQREKCGNQHANSSVLIPTMRINLVTPFAEKDAVKSLGARWDAVKKVWYITDVADLTPFMRWIPDLEKATEKSGDSGGQATENAAVATMRRSEGVWPHNSLQIGDKCLSVLRDIKLNGAVTIFLHTIAR